MKKLIILIFFIHICFFFACKSKESKEIKETKFLLNTFVEIQIKDNRKLKNLDPIWNEIQKLEDLFNPYSKNSEISKINNNAGIKPIKVSNQTIDVLKKTLEIAKISNGIFDPTIYPLIKEWKQNSDITKIKNMLNLVDYKKIRIENNTVFLEKKGMQIDLGGIAKGYIIDKTVDILKAYGVKSGIVNAGGDIRVFGQKEWIIGIKNPKNKNKILDTIKLKNQAIATSGNYERPNHILNPKTGLVANISISATVIARDATTADALATVVFILGNDEGTKLIKKIPNARAIIIDKKKLHNLPQNREEDNF